MDINHLKKPLSNVGLFDFFQKFEGDIERENAESLAADIAEFLNNRTKRSRAGTMPVNIDPIYYETVFLIVNRTLLTRKVTIFLEKVFQ